MTYPCLCHDRNSHRVHDLLDHLWVRHARNTTLGSYVRRYPFKGHHGASTRFFCYSCLCRSVSAGCVCEVFGFSTCSALTTSIMTPPFNIFARPVLTVKLVDPFWLSPSGPCPLVVTSLVIPNTVIGNQRVPLVNEFKQSSDDVKLGFIRKMAESVSF